MVYQRDEILQDLTDSQALAIAEFHAKIDLIPRLPDLSKETLRRAACKDGSLDLGPAAAQSWDLAFLTKKGFASAVGELTPAGIKEQLWGAVKHEDPDSLVVRHLLATDWEVDEAINMMIDSARWRYEFTLLSDLLRGGDEAHVAAASDTSTEAGKTAEAIVKQFRSGKSYLRGRHKDGTPIFWITPKVHLASAQSAQGLEMYILYHIESLRMLLRPPHPSVFVVFDLGGFSMANMDWNALSILRARLLEKYPRAVNGLIVYRAPWVFTGIWQLLKAWIPAEAKGRVHFFSSPAELAQHVDMSTVPADKGGESPWSFTFPEPVEGENAVQKDTAARDALGAERAAILDRYHEATRAWVDAVWRKHQGAAPGETGEDAAPAAAEGRLKELAEQRQKLADELADNYWKRDKYVRGRNMYDRDPSMTCLGYV